MAWRSVWLQGRSVQHRRPGPVPDGRPRLGHRRRAAADSPPVVAVPLALAAGMVVGAAWGFIPGFLKAISGAHEVVTTIMLNFVAIAILAAAVSGPLNVVGSPSPTTLPVGNASLPVILGRNGTIAHHLRPDHGRALRLAAVPHDTRVRDPHRRARALTQPDTPACRPKRLIIWTMSVSGHARRHGRRDRPPGRDPPDVDDLRHDGRLRRHRGRSARAHESDRDRPRGAAVRRDAHRRVGDADPGRRAGRAGRGPPGDDPVLPRRQPGHQADLPAERRRDRTRGRRRRSRATYGGEATIR